MKFELYKIFRKRIVAILIGISLLWGLFSILQPALQYVTYTEQMEALKGISAIRYDRDLQNRYAGQYTMDELAPLYEEAEEIYNNPDYQSPTDKNGKYSFSSAGGNTTPLTDEAYYRYLNRYGVVSLVGARTIYIPLYVADLKATGDLSESYYGSIVQSAVDDNLIPPANPEGPIVQKLLKMYHDLQYPFYGSYMDGWGSFFNIVPTFFQWILPLIIIGIVPVFAEESSSGSDKVLLATRYGKTRMIRNKIVACFLYVTFVFWIFVLFLILIHIGIYGTSGLSASIQLVAHCKLSPYNLSI